MSAIKPAGTRRGRQAGSASVEFGLIAVVFFMFIFAVIELARLMFLFNTLEDATRRAASAAAITNFKSESDLNKVRWRALFRSNAGGLVLMPELTDQAIRIDYLALRKGEDGALSLQPMTTLPETPAENRRNCLVDPYAANCIRLVRVRVCDPTDTAVCKPMMFTTLTSVIRFQMPLPIATTIAQAQSLGLRPD